LNEVYWLLALAIVGIVAFLVAFLWMNGRLKDQASENQKERQILIDEHGAQLKSKIDQGIQKSREVRVGDAGQHWAPYFTDFDYNPADARFIGGPIDFVIFDGYTEWLDGKKDRELKIVLAEVKSAKSRLTDGQRMIKKAIDKGEVKLAFYTYKLPKSVQGLKEDRIPLSLDDIAEEDEGG
jgi:predicted Holliday junction resolvase-like endonuclease